jgi:proline dehydrogenase
MSTQKIAPSTTVSGEQQTNKFSWFPSWPSLFSSNRQTKESHNNEEDDTTASAEKKLSNLIAGLSLREAVNHAAELARSHSNTKCLLNIAGEHYQDKALADEDTRKYCSLIKLLRWQNKCPCSISIKPTQIGCGINKEEFLANLDKIVTQAARRKASGLPIHAIAVEVDMETPETMDDTIDVFCQLASKHRHDGILLRLAIQAEFRRSRKVAERVVASGGGVRLVRGKAYADIDPSLVYNNDDELNDNFVAIAKAVAPSGKLAVASGNMELLKRVPDAVGASSSRTIEYQFLLGLPHHDTIARNLAAEGKQVAVYMPCGEWNKVRGYVGRRKYLTDEEYQALDKKYHFTACSSE